MFEVRFQTYWSEVDGAGIVYFSHFFSFVERAEEELFRAAGKERHLAYEENRVWMPRVEAFSKFSKPIQHGRAIRVQLNPQIRGLKTLRYDFVILDDETKERFVPHVIEPAAGATRATLAFLCEAFAEEEVEGETRTVLFRVTIN